MSVARHPRPPELIDVPIEDIMQKYVGRFREKKPDWAAFEDAKIEGYKRAPHPKLEVYRACVGKPLLHLDDPAIVAVASNEPLPKARVPVVNLDDIEGIADILIRHAAPIDAVLAHAGPG